MKTLIISILSFGLAFYYTPSVNNETEIIKVTGTVVNTKKQPLIGANVLVHKTTTGTITNIQGHFELEFEGRLPATLIISYTGFLNKVIKVDKNNSHHIIELENGEILEEILVSGYISKNNKRQAKTRGIAIQEQTLSCFVNVPSNTEQYSVIKENTFKSSIEEPLSTFSLDVDRAAYSNVRRFLNHGTRPPKDAVRIEEMLNYFEYDYSAPSSEDPLAIHTTLSSCLWNKQHQLLHIGLQAKKIDKDNLPPSNLVFLIDVSGSMNAENKLSLVKSSFNLLLDNMKNEDKIAIVTYAGRASVLLESTSGSEKKKIREAIKKLGAGGSTGGAEGIRTAYELAKENFIDGGNNRVILATDGDFNVGISSVKDLETLIEHQRKSSIYLTVLGYGMGNYKDEQMQTLANKGNGNHAYIDNIQEAHKVLISEFAGTMHTIAKDVKFQLEFNPAYVQAYRLIGYENRLLEKEDFNNDSKDAGEIGYGHQMTAIYEIVPAGIESHYVGNVDDLKYQENKKSVKSYSMNGELATVKFRYKDPEKTKSKLLQSTISSSELPFSTLSADIRFSYAVAEFGMLLRESGYIVDGTIDNVIKIAENARGEDKNGYRAEFVRLAKAASKLSGEIVTR